MGAESCAALRECAARVLRLVCWLASAAERVAWSCLLLLLGLVHQSGVAAASPPQASEATLRPEADAAA